MPDQPTDSDNSLNLQNAWQPLQAPLRNGAELHMSAVTDTAVSVLVPDVMDTTQMQYMHVPAFQDTASATHFLVSSFTDRAHSCNWLLMVDSCVAGWISLFRFDHDMCELGYFVKAASAGHGIASAAAVRVTHFAHSELHVRRLNATADPRNSASEKVLSRSGFTREGTQRANFRYGDAWQDTALFGRLSSDPLPALPRNTAT